MVTVGVQGGGYIEDRCVLRKPDPGVRMVRAYDAVDVANVILRRVFHASHGTAFLNCFHQGGWLPRVNGYHLVNSLSLSRRPWITTFEHYLPRWNAHSRFGMRLIARKNCLAIIGLSAYARRAMEVLLDDHEDLRAAITSKMHVLHPPQPALIGAWEEKHLDPQVPTFAFVGREFFRKGGMEILQAAAILRNEGLRFRVYIISNLECGDYVTRSVQADVEKARREMAALGDTIVFRGEMPNTEVLATLRASHAALLPTFDDTYGFSVLEAQACGTPAITTDVCALHETNSEETGWLISLPHDKWGQAYRNGATGLAGLSMQVREGLVRAMRDVIANPASVRLKGTRALERIRTHHDPDRHAATLVGLYQMFIPRP